jgi:hypothetical protein
LRGAADAGADMITAHADNSSAAIGAMRQAGIAQGTCVLASLRLGVWGTPHARSSAAKRARNDVTTGMRRP